MTPGSDAAAEAYDRYTQQQADKYWNIEPDEEEQTDDDAD
jgi:hypothetical protein